MVHSPDAQITGFFSRSGPILTPRSADGIPECVAHALAGSGEKTLAVGLATGSRPSRRAVYGRRATASVRAQAAAAWVPRPFAHHSPGVSFGLEIIGLGRISIWTDRRAHTSGAVKAPSDSTTSTRLARPPAACTMPCRGHPTRVERQHRPDRRLQRRLDLVAPDLARQAGGREHEGQAVASRPVLDGAGGPHDALDVRSDQQQDACGPLEDQAIHLVVVGSPA